GRRIADKLPAWRRLQCGPGIRQRIVNLTLIGEFETSEVVFAAFDKQATVRKNRRSKRIWTISGRQTGQLFPGAIHVAAVLVGRELPPVGVCATLRHDGSIRELKGNNGAVRSRMGKVLDRLRQRKRISSNNHGGD